MQISQHCRVFSQVVFAEVCLAKNCSLKRKGQFWCTQAELRKMICVSQNQSLPVSEEVYNIHFCYYHSFLPTMRFPAVFISVSEFS